VIEDNPSSSIIQQAGTVGACLCTGIAPSQLSKSTSSTSPEELAMQCCCSAALSLAESGLLYKKPEHTGLHAPGPAGSVLGLRMLPLQQAAQMPARQSK
jgi:hypothetical protein